MKRNMKIEDLTSEQMLLVENFCKKIDLEDLTLTEKIAINFVFNEKLSKYPLTDIVSDAYPNTDWIGGSGAVSTKQDVQILIALFSLKRDLEISTKQSTLIQQNQQVIEQNKTIIDQNQEVINLLKEIKDK